MNQRYKPQKNNLELGITKNKVFTDYVCIVSMSKVEREFNAELFFCSKIDMIKLYWKWTHRPNGCQTRTKKKTSNKIFPNWGIVVQKAACPSRPLGMDGSRRSMWLQSSCGTMMVLLCGGPWCQDGGPSALKLLQTSSHFLPHTFDDKKTTRRLHANLGRSLGVVWRKQNKYGGGYGGSPSFPTSLKPTSSRFTLDGCKTKHSHAKWKFLGRRGNPINKPSKILMRQKLTGKERSKGGELNRRCDAKKNIFEFPSFICIFIVVSSQQSLQRGCPFSWVCLCSPFFLTLTV